MHIDHIGYAVKNIEKAQMSFINMGFIFGPLTEDFDRNTYILFGEKDGYRIELVSPLDKNKPSPVDNYLTNVRGMPYHICYESSNFENDVLNMVKQGSRIVIEPKPAIAFSGRRVVFLMNLGMGLFEIVEK